MLPSKPCDGSCNVLKTVDLPVPSTDAKLIVFGRNENGGGRLSVDAVACTDFVAEEFDGACGVGTDTLLKEYFSAVKVYGPDP